MSTLLEIRENIKRIYGKYETYITPALKFLVTFVAIIMINSELGYMSLLNNAFVVLMASLACAVLPWGFSLIVSAIFVVGHTYAMAMECALVSLVIFVIMFLLYFRFTPKDALVVLLTPICFFLKIPYLIPICVGLAGTPAGIVSVGCGVVVHYMIDSVSESTLAMSGAEAEASDKLRMMLNGIMGNTTMVITLFSFVVTIVIVYIIRRMSIDYAWTIAMVTGTVINAMILLIGDLLLDTKISIIWLLIGSVLSILAAKVLQFFVFNVDYSRTEKVQFEDDEYYYYVKAVPKVNVVPASKTVKKINSSKTY